MKCQTKRCTRPALPNGKCRRCYLRDWRAKNKMKYAFQTSKDNAKRRGKEFDLDIEYYSKFAIESKYLIGKGRTATSLHIDRIEEHLGYVKDNVQVLENAVNVRKSLNYRFNERGKPVDFHVTTHYPSKEREDVPY